MDHSDQVEEFRAAVTICSKPEYQITTPVNGIKPEYPRWPEAFKACEEIWRAHLEWENKGGEHAEEDRETVVHEARKLRGH
jgi:hypothetical protein